MAGGDTVNGDDVAPSAEDDVKEDDGVASNQGLRVQRTTLMWSPRMTVIA
jgi:hypothetical protein